MTILLIFLTIATVGIMLMQYSLAVQLGEVALALRGANQLRIQMLIELRCLTAAVSEMSTDDNGSTDVCAQTAEIETGKPYGTED